MPSFCLSLCSELNGAIAESEMQIRNIPHGLPQQDVIQRYSQSNNRLIILVAWEISSCYLEFYVFACLLNFN